MPECKRCNDTGTRYVRCGDFTHEITCECVDNWPRNETPCPTCGTSPVVVNGQCLPCHNASPWDFNPETGEIIPTTAPVLQTAACQTEGCGNYRETGERYCTTCLDNVAFPTYDDTDWSDAQRTAWVCFGELPDGTVPMPSAGRVSFMVPCSCQSRHRMASAFLANAGENIGRCVACFGVGMIDAGSPEMRLIHAIFGIALPIAALPARVPVPACAVPSCRRPATLRQTSSGDTFGYARRLHESVLWCGGHAPSYTPLYAIAAN